MQYVIGGLLILIIVSGGWLIYFYKKTSEQRVLVNESWDQLQSKLKKKEELKEKCIELETQLFDCNEKSLDKTANAHFLLKEKLKEIQEQIDVCQFVYNDAVTSYNKLLSTFPNNLFSLIIGKESF